VAAPERTRPDRIATYDLHLHTHWSYDALTSVEAHFKRAAELGVRCIAVTEHHLTDAREEIREVGARYPTVRSIPAAELSVTVSCGAVDLVCYGLPDEPSAGLKTALDAYHAWQRESGAAFQQGMQAIGFDFTEAHHHALIDGYRPAKATAVQGYTHVRNGVLRDYFIERGFIENEDGYAPLRRRVAEAVSLPPYPDAARVIPAVHEAGGLVGIAHPYGYFGGADRERMDALRVELDLDGVECAHPGVPAELTPVYREYCVEHGLFSSGGSDAHTDEDVATVFARHLGEDAWLDELIDRLGAA